MDAQLGDFTPFFHAYETWNSGWYDKDGTLQYAGIDEGIKTTLTKLNGVVQQRLLPERLCSL
ncbi:MAG: hypothetical protein ACLR6B_00435 [Blautia sp.]